MDETTTKPKKKTTTRTTKKKTEDQTPVVDVSANEPLQTPASESIHGAVSRLGRRKTAVASVRLIPSGSGLIQINRHPMDAYFVTFEQRATVRNALKVSGQEGTVDVHVRVRGGGLCAQADAVRLGISRALIEWNPVYRKTLKKLGYLSRDPRAKERKKFGLKRARRAPQWSKR